MPFSDVIGHRQITAWLARQVATQTLGHAYLLQGPAGVGKRFLAQQMAQAIHCPQPVDGDACGQCPACRSVAQGRHPDVLVVEVPAGHPVAQQIKIEQVRQLQHWLALAPFQARRKVAIVDGADTMQEVAASALLKTLEEPPPTAVLIVVAVHENRLLPTIVSRCTRLRCHPLPTDQLVRALMGQGIERSRAEGVARRATGRVGYARHLASDEVWERQRTTLEAWLAAVDAEAVELPWVARPRAELEEILEDIAAWYRDVLLVHAGAASGAFAYPDRQELARAQADRWSPHWLLETIDAVYATRALVQQHVNPRAALAVLVTRLSRLDPSAGMGAG